MGFQAAAFQGIGIDYCTLEMFGGGCSGDNTPALNQAVSYCGANNLSNIRLLKGNYNFYTAPAAFVVPIRISGQGSSMTSLVRCYSANANYEGFFTWADHGSNGGGMSDVQVVAADQTTNGALIAFVVATTNSITGFFHLDDIVTSYQGTGSYSVGLYADGHLNAVNGSQGLRDLNVRDSYFFASGGESVRIVNGVNHTLDLWANGPVTITGGGSSLTNSTDCRLRINCLGQLTVDNATRIVISEKTANLVFGPGASHCTFIGQISGSLSNAGVANRVIN